MATTTYPNFNYGQYPIPTSITGNWQSTNTIKTPCCPYCHQLDIEEIAEKDELFEAFKEEFLKTLKEKIAKEIADKKG